MITASDAGDTRTVYRLDNELIYLPMLLTALNVENGQELWRTPLPGSVDVHSATQDAERLYLVSGWRVYAINVNDGEQLWETEEFSGHTGYYFRPWDATTPLHLYATTPKMILIDPFTGAVVGEEATGEMLTYDDMEFATDIGRLEAKDRSSGTVLWQQFDNLPPQAHMVLWPAFIEDDVIFRTGILNFSLSRAPRRTGVTQWETSPVYISNFALSNGRLYILREDNALVTLDANSGVVLDEIAISGPKPDLQLNYWVAAQPPYILVYFGNTFEWLWCMKA